jgi:hypothetical protein
MRKSTSKRHATIALGTASSQTKGAGGLFTDDVLKNRGTGLSAE